MTITILIAIAVTNFVNTVIINYWREDEYAYFSDALFDWVSKTFAWSVIALVLMYIFQSKMDQFFYAVGGSPAQS